MGTAVVPKGDVKLDKAQLDALITQAVEKAIGPKLTEALQPLTQKQTDLMKEMLEVSKRQEQHAKTDDEKGLMFARQARAMYLGHGDVERAIFEVKRQWGADDPVLKGLEGTIKLKNLSVGNAGAGGNIVIPEWSREWIELLRNQTVIRGLRGIRTFPMPVGALTMRKQGSAATAFYVGEAVNITKSDQAVQVLNMVYKKLAALTVVSNDLLRFAGPEADAFVRDDLLLVSAIREDLAFLFGDGTAGTPTGIWSLTAAANKFASAGTTLANQQADMGKAIRLLQEGNVPLNTDNGYWIMAPRTYWGIYNLTATTGNYVFREEMSSRDANAPQGRLLGYPIRVTNQVSKTLGATGIGSTGTASLLMFVHSPSCLIGDSLNVQADVFLNGTYYDGAAVVSGISTDESVIRVLREHDFSLRHDVGASTVFNETIQ
jgi:HK97 family phage major capsid protein